MRRIEEGRFGQEYLTSVDPYSVVIQQFHPDHLNDLLAHDFSRFASEFASAYPASSLRDVLRSSFRNVRIELPALLEAGFDSGSAKLPDRLSPRTLGIFDRGVKIAPFFGAYALALLDSASYIEALRTGDKDIEEKSLVALAGREVPLAAICSSYQSQFYVDGRENDEPAINIDGVRFIILYNLLTNAKRHSIPLIAGTPITSTTHYETTSGRLTVSNLARESHVKKLASGGAIQTGHYGHFIAGLYTAVAGLELEVGSVLTGDYFTEVKKLHISEVGERIVNESEEKPVYKVTATLGN